MVWKGTSAYSQQFEKRWLQQLRRMATTCMLFLMGFNQIKVIECFQHVQHFLYEPSIANRSFTQLMSRTVIPQTEKTLARTAEGRVPIDFNCAATVFGKSYPLTPGAEQQKELLNELVKKDVIRSTAMLFASDSEFSFIGMTPLQRMEAVAVCNGQTLWRPEANDLEICNLLVGSVVVDAKLEPSKLNVNVYTDNRGTTSVLYHFYTKTIESQSCFNYVVDSKRVDFGRRHSPMITATEYQQAAKRNVPVEFVLLSPSPEKKTMPVVFQVTRRKKSTTEAAKKAVDFSARQIFFSPNDAAQYLHKLEAVMFLSDSLLQKLVETAPPPRLDALLSRFAVQAIYLDDAKPDTHRPLLETLRSIAEKTGATLYSSSKINNFQTVPLKNLLTTALKRDETTDRKADYPLFAYPQVLVISDSEDVLKNKAPYLHLKLSDGEKLTQKQPSAAVTPKASQRTPKTSTEQKSTGAIPKTSKSPTVAEKKTATVKLPTKTSTTKFLKSLADAGFHTVVIDSVPEWDIQPLEGGPTLLFAEYPTKTGPHVAYITNRPERYRAYKHKVGKAFLDACVYPIHKASFPHCLTEKDEMTYDVNERAKQSLAHLLRDVGSGKTLAKKLKRGGIENVVFTGDKSKTKFWETVTKELATLGVPERPYTKSDEEKQFSEKKELIVVEPTHKRQPPGYLTVTVDYRGNPILYTPKIVQLTEGPRFKEIYPGKSLSRAEEMERTFSSPSYAFQ